MKGYNPLVAHPGGIDAAVDSGNRDMRRVMSFFMKDNYGIRVHGL
jgi:hypothetical protein